MTRYFYFFCALFFVFTASVEAGRAQARLKDLVDFDGVRGNDLLGYGLVVGLNGTGDGVRNSPFTEEIMVSILERLGINVSGEQFRPRNVAAVMVTATLPPFSRSGSRVDVTISAIGDATSLLGGTLVLTPLSGADGQIYAVAQGNVLSGGVSVVGQAAQEVRGVPTSGTIPLGARVEREVDFDLRSLESVRLALRNPDFTTAEQIERAINSSLGRPIAMMQDAGTVVIDLRGSNFSTPAHVISRVENIEIQPQTRAKVVMDQRSGTIVIGADVRISRVAVAQGSLTLRVEEDPLVVQPSPFADGETIVVPRTATELIDQVTTNLAEVPNATSLSDVMSGLSALGVGPRDLIDILSTIHAAGALHAELIIR